MPRRKRTFIQRSQAQTFHVVRQPTPDNPDHHVLVSDSSVFSNISGDGLDVAELAKTYKPRDYDLGEFGFPDDGYNYAKHFRHIGGGGGVFMSAETGLPDPDAVRNPDRTRTVKATPKSTLDASTKTGDVVVLKDASNADFNDGDEADDDDDGNGIIIDPQALAMQKEAEYQLERDRKWNPDLDEVLMELADEPSDADEAEEVNEVGESSEGEVDVDEFFDVLLNDNSVESTDGIESASTQVPAAIGEEKSTANVAGLDAIVEKYREPRLLDAQFDTFMRAFDDDDTSSEDEELSALRRHAETNAGDEDDILALLTESEKGQLAGDANIQIEYDDYDENGHPDDTDADDLLQNLSQLKLLDDCTASNSLSLSSPKLSTDQCVPPTTTEKETLNIDDGYPQTHTQSHSQAQIDCDSPDESARKREEVEGYRQAEFEQGMDSVLAAYERVGVEEILCGAEGEGVEGALRAMERQDQEEMERLRHLDDLGVDLGESDDHDSELDTLFEEQYNKNNEDQWDCQTIISTYTNLENHPSVIDAPCRHAPRPSTKQTSAGSIIQLDPRTQAPAQFVPAGASAAPSATAHQPIDFGSRRANEPVMFNHGSRRKDESKHDKKARKAAVREAARERRALKSEMKKAFGAEGVKQNKHSAALGNSKVAIRF